MTPTAQARIDVIAADGGCVALAVDRQCGPCHDRSGAVWPWPVLQDHDQLEVDRIRDAATMGKAPSHTDRTRMVALCPGHHRGVGEQGGYVWATAHRAELRAYLSERNKRMGW